MPRPLRTIAPTLLLTLASLAAPSPALAAPAWTCEGSAIRGSVLGQAPIEPLTANKGAATCTPQRAGLAGLTAGLPLPVGVTALGAETIVQNPDQPVGNQKVAAVGGVADLRIQALPALPIQIPLPDLSQIPPVELPGGLVSVDLRPALAALLPDGRLPNADIVRIQNLIAYANGECTADGGVQLTGTSRVSGITVLGQEVPLNQLVERTVSIVDSETIDPSKLNVLDIPLPPGVEVTPLIRQTLQDALDALPDIQIPAAVATVRITPGQQVREGDRLTQRALQVQVGLLGQPLVDLVVGEASVGASEISCAPPPPPPPPPPPTPEAPDEPQSAAESALQCTTRRLVLADVIPGRTRVRLLGYADKRYIGRTVRIRFTATGKNVARARVRRDGSFRTSAPMPSQRLRFKSRARYQARVGRERSLRLKLMRRMIVSSVRTRGRRVTIAGRVVPPLAMPVRKIEVRRRVSCSRWRVVKRIRPSSSGRFRTTIAGPPRRLAATYRFATRVRSSSGGDSRKTFETYTLPRFVDLG